MKFEKVIGLEVHAQLKTETKIFCSCSAKFGAPPNTHVCPVCTGMPGSLPVLNKKAVDFAILMGLATGCTIAGRSVFARKNYFYPDLPKGYQISQYELPLAERGFIDIETDGRAKRIGITRIHMEEDAGKLVHEEGMSMSRVDLNRTGVPLLEIVSEPDMNSPGEAGAYLRKLRSILRYLGICDGNMEEGSFRCDANISLKPRGSERLGVRTETKNLNSFRNVEKAIAYEADRQADVIMEGREVIQETRLWNPDKKATNSMRGKEDAHDYRYFPDPDLAPVVVDDSWVSQLKESLPELPEQRKKRFMSEYDLTEHDADFISTERDLADYFETCAKLVKSPRLAANRIMGDLNALLNSEKIEVKDSPVSAENLAQLIRLMEDGTISGKIAKNVFDEMAKTGKEAGRIVKEKGLKQVSDSGAIEKVVKDVLDNHPDEVAKYKAGKKKLMGFFVGRIMKETKGKANPKVVNEILGRLLS